jgi:hypothetical protein
MMIGPFVHAGPRALADDPPETWQTVRRLAGLGHD